MSHPLQSKLQAVQRKIRLLWLLHGAGWLIAITLGVALVLIAADYLLRFEDLGLRVMASGTLLTFLFWSLYRFVWVPLRAKLTPLEVALRLERHFPALAGRLASSLQFLSEPADDPRSGSDELRRIVVHDTSQKLAQCNLDHIIDHRPVVRSISVAVSIVLLASALFALQPRLATIGVQRLVRPLANHRWPQANYLVLRNPVQRVASGQPFEVEVVDRRGAKLPAEVWMIYEHAQPDGTFVEQREQLPIVADAAIARREHVTRSFAYRAIGGDDHSMLWTIVEVVDPPALNEVEITLHYPEYTGWPESPSERQLRAVAGTHVSMRGTASKTLSKATIHHDDGREIALQLNDTGTEFHLPADAATPLVIDKNGSYWFEFVDRDGLTAGSEVRYEMRALPDLAPSVTIDAPAASSFATPAAMIPVKITATDDLAIRTIELQFLRSDRSDEGSQSLLVYQGPPQPPPPAVVSAANRDHGERRTVEHRWDLSPMGLTPGVQLTFNASATDYRPSSGQSAPRHLTIVAPDELERRLEERHAFLLTELNRVLKLQRSSRQHVGAVQIQAQQVGQLDQPDLERLQAAELDQRQVDRALSSRGDGLRHQLRGVLTDIQNNQLDNPEIKRRTESIERELARLEQEQLPRIERALTNSQKRLKSNRQGRTSPVDATSNAELQDASRNQDQVIAMLEQLLGGLTQWDSQRRLVRELADLEQDQEEIARRTAEIGRETLTKRTAQLTPQQLANLKKLAAEQQELARRFDAALQSMRQAGQQLELDDPLAAQAIADATAKASQAATSGKMRQAGANIDDNQIGQASARQQAIADDLQEMLDILSNRREHELARLVKKLREAEEQLSQLRQQQAGLRKRLDELSQSPSSDQRQQQLEQLAQQQRELEEQTQRMARQLERLQAQRPANQLAQGATKMGQASSQSQQGQASEARDSADQAKQDLDRAQAQLAQQRQQAERDLAHEQYFRMRDQLATLRDRQEAAVEETQRLDSLRAPSGQLSTAQRDSLTNAAAAQQELADQAAALSGKLAEARAFALALSSATGDMRYAADRLRNLQTDQATISRQRQALTRLEQLLSALAADEQDMADAESPGDDAGGGDAGSQGEGPPGEQIPPFAQLKLVKLMQEGLNQRTADIAQRLAAQRTNDQEVQADLRALVDEQRQLADIVRDLSDATETEPASAPAPANERDTPDLQELLPQLIPSE